MLSVLLLVVALVVALVPDIACRHLGRFGVCVCGAKTRNEKCTYTPSSKSTKLETEEND